MVLEGHLDENGAFVPTGYDKKGDCPNCATTGECLFTEAPPFFGFDVKISVLCGW